MIIIADSGSTKTTWSLVDRETGDHQTEVTAGINPFYQDEDSIFTLVKESFGQPPSEVSCLWFYGAGCANQQVNQIVSNALERFFAPRSIEVASDLMAAARSLCQQSEGLVAILGTGSNSCYYDGQKISHQVSPLGFILGDEGSGAVLGKRLLADILKKQLPGHIGDLFFKAYPIQPAEILDRIYKQPFPNRYAAGFTRFMADHLEEPAIQNLIIDEFRAFLRRNVLQYEASAWLPLHATGSIAWHFRDLLQQATKAERITLGSVVRDPMPGLLRYHHSQH